MNNTSSWLSIWGHGSHLVNNIIMMCPCTQYKGPFFNHVDQIYADIFYFIIVDICPHLISPNGTAFPNVTLKTNYPNATIIAKKGNVLSCYGPVQVKKILGNLRLHPSAIRLYNQCLGISHWELSVNHIIS